MGSSEKFCLRWNDFESNISTAFRELREEKDFFDVTLACDDSQIQAHKVILSACSPFFRNVLRRNPHQHPLLYLKGVKYQELLSVLNFMYHGEVNVAQEELNSFLSVAEDLRVKGLTQNSSSSQQQTYKQEPAKQTPVRARDPPERPDVSPAPPKRPRPPAPAPLPPGRGSSSYPDDDIQEVMPLSTVKSEPGSSSSSMVPETVPQQHHQHQEQEQYEEGGTVALHDTEYQDVEGYDYTGYDEQGYEEGNYDPNDRMQVQDGNKALFDE